jgi:hypothetical protein
MSGPPAGGERGWGHHPEPAVGSGSVVILAVVLDQYLRLGEAGEQLDGQQPVSDAAVEALDERVLPW